MTRQGVTVITFIVIIFAAVAAVWAGGRYSRDRASEDVVVINGSTTISSHPLQKSGDSYSAGDTRLGQTSSRKPLSFDEARAAVMSGSRDLAWAPAVEQQLMQALGSRAGVRNLVVICQSAGCAVTGVIQVDSQSQARLNELGQTLDNAAGLMPVDTQGDKYRSFRIVNNSPLVLEFSALGFRR